MKKIICIFSVAFLLILLSVSVFGLTSYEEAPGGVVRNADELVAAFGTGNAVITKSGAVRLETDIVLLDSIVIKEGSYTIIGGGCGIYRGFNEAPLIKLENGASLTLEKSASSQYVDDNDQDLLISGRRSEFPNGGSLISLSGGSELTVNSEVVFENSSVGTLGGAIYAEGGSKVTLTNCGFRSCTSSVGGGAVAVVCDKLGSEGGSLNMSGVLFKENTAVNTQSNAKGGAIYVYGGAFNASSCIFEKNTADMGGAMWSCSEGTVSACDANYNKANASGAVIYCASDDTMVGKVNISEGMFMNNTSDGNGGFSANFGAMIIGGSYVSENTALADGGAVYNEGSLAFTEGTLLSNTCGGRGGGVCNIGKGSVFAMSGGEINTNKGLFGAGVFCQGTFSMNGGAIGNNVSEEAGIVVYQDMTLSASAMISETIALCISEDKRPAIKINGELSSKSGFEVMCVQEKTDKNGNISRYAAKNALGASVLVGDVENNADKFIVKSGFLKYGVNSEGRLSLRFPFFPIWVWICVLVATLVTAVTVIYKIKTKKENS